MFSSSTKSVSATVQEIAGTVGASADSEMTARALVSLSAAIKHFNGRARWAWLLTEAAPVALVAPFTVAVTCSAGQASASAASGHGVQVDDLVIGNALLLGMRVTATAAGGFSFATAVSGITGTQSFTISAVRDFYDLPSDVKAVYSFRLLSGNRYLKPANRRAYDRLVSDEGVAGTPEAYDIFQFGAKGKVRILPPPSAAGVVFLRYYRRMTVPTTSATAGVLDIPQDYDDYLTARGKWHFLTDKDQGRGQQATTWLSVSENGLKTMLADQAQQPDEDLGFSPGHTSWSDGVNSTRSINWDVT